METPEYKFGDLILCALSPTAPAEDWVLQVFLSQCETGDCLCTTVEGFRTASKTDKSAPFYRMPYYQPYVSPTRKMTAKELAGKWVRNIKDGPARLVIGISQSGDDFIYAALLSMDEDREIGEFKASDMKEYSENPGDDNSWKSTEVAR